MFFIEAIKWYNIPYTIFLAAIFLYWITVILGFFDVEIFDFEVEIDSFLDILNIGSLPFSIWISIFVFQMWMYSIICNIVINVLPFTLPGFVRFAGVFLVIFFASGVLTKYITMPLQKLFNFETVKKNDFVGKRCLVTSSEVSATFGTAEIRIDGDVQILDVRVENDLDLKKGDTALIKKYDDENDLFYLSKIE